MSAEEFEVPQPLFARVVEMSMEPSYISEIARKIALFDEGVDLSYNSLVPVVSKAVNILDQNDRAHTRVVGHGESGGQATSSPKPSGFVVDERTWEEYKVVELKDKNPMSIRNEYSDVVDINMTIQEKVDIISTLSSDGNRMSRIAESLVADQVSVIDLITNVVQSEYESGSVDVVGETDGSVNLFEVSVRWENPIQPNYVESKLNQAIDLEPEFGKPSNLFIIAPNFTGGVMDRFSDSDIIRFVELPRSDGFPVITRDDSQTISNLTGSDFVGDEYPSVPDVFRDFTSAMDSVYREYTGIPESRYRSNLLNRLEGEIG